MKMSGKKKKVQVVILRYDREQLQWHVLRLRTNKKRGRFWQNVTGSIESYDQNFRQGALRELREETGLKGKNVRKCTSLKLSYEFTSKKGATILEKCFVAIVTSDKIKIDPKEHDKYEWKILKKIKRDDYLHPLNFRATRLAYKLVSAKR